MVRTQIYLTRRQREDLASLAKALGRNQSELIREAIDRLLEKKGGTYRREVLDKAAGMWKRRKDLPDFRSVRRTCDRS